MATAEIIPGRKRGLAPTIRKLKLRHPELTDSEIARRVKCDPSNVAGVLKTFLGDHSHEDLQAFQSNRADIIDAVSHRILESVTGEKIAKGSALQLVTAFGILHDKSQVLRGQATGINMIQLVDLVEAIKLKDSQSALNPRTIRATIDDVSPLRADKRNDADESK